MHCHGTIYFYFLDMTLEATLTKLHVLLSRPGDRKTVADMARRQMEKPLCGELSL